MIGRAKDRVPSVKRRSSIAVVVLAVLCATLASSISGQSAASAFSGDDQFDQKSDADDIAEVAAAYTSYKITFDGDGQFSQALEVEAIMPDGAFVDGHRIDISERLANIAADPILESNPLWFIQLEAIPKIGKSAQLSGSSVIRYDESESDTKPAIIDPVRAVEQGRRETITLADGSEISSCKFVTRSSTGRQVATAFVEIAFDPDSCRRAVEFGIVSHEAPSEVSADDSDDGGSAASISAPSAEGSGLPEGSTAPDGLDFQDDGAAKNDFRLEIPDFRAKTRSQVRELAYPILPATSEVHAQVEVWNQQPQYSPSKWKWWSNWLTRSGWRRDSHYSWSDRNSDYIYVGESSNYSNPIFANVVCSGALPVPFSPGTTYAGHTVQTVGYANLTSEHYVLNYKHGGCSYLLRTNQTDNFWWINRS